MPPTIPSKLYFSISEVSDMTGVKPHVLRYWESEFSDLKPKKNRAGNRSYREKDIKMVMTIRDLLYAQGFTINGARMRLRDELKKESAPAAAQLELQPAWNGDKTRQVLRTMKRELEELRKRLD